MADDFVELVWKNGQILMRGRSSSPSCISDSSHHSPKPQVKTSGGEIYTSKRRRLGTVNSLSDFDDCLPGRKELSKHKHSVQDNCHPDHLFPGFHENNLNIFLETTRNNNTYDEYLTESQIVPECKDENLRQLHEPSLQQCQDSVPISRTVANRRQNLSSMARLPNSNLQQLKSGPEKNLGSRNFSLFLRPGVLPKADDQHHGAIEPAGGQSSLRVRDLESKEDTPPAGEKALVLESPLGSRGGKDFHKHPDLVAIKTDHLKQIANPLEESPPDEQSEVPVYRNAIRSKRFQDRVPDSTSSLPVNTVNGNPDREKSEDQLAADTSTCSWGASNDLSYSSLKRKNKDKEAMASPRENAEGDQQVPKPASARAAAKRRRPEVYNQYEREGRDKIDEKMRALQALIPNCSKMDKASTLDKAIEYLKALQLQLQIMSLGTGFCMPPMIVPTGMQQATHLAHFSAMGMGVGMGMRMPMGVGYTPAIFSNSAMLGLPLSQVPFIPLAGGSSATSVPVVQNINTESMNKQ
ncbi:hypothetical protein P3X46_014980 [Hevea brasiliensis]|uniref:BHLH domain-containing protein n=1 Tax=Hevea brasiliensis TaxID=3981 RepID=A0ABQ9LWP0_HEVBR|nr:transcription factor PHYTOCHROME INTERACTING FACTOR-LIKE 15 [Hevea brasiliensis]KAJ9171642.1 hypothetical protein P3X46_014980 [Hevea brasiliensis]